MVRHLLFSVIPAKSKLTSSPGILTAWANIHPTTSCVCSVHVLLLASFIFHPLGSNVGTTLCILLIMFILLVILLRLYMR